MAECGFEPLNIVVAFPKTEKGKSLRDEMNALKPFRPEKAPPPSGKILK